MKSEQLKIEKLPKWAQDQIRQLESERDVAVRALNKFQDEQTVSEVWTEEYVCTGERPGPPAKRKYIQSNRINIEHAGIELAVHLSRKDDSQRSFGIQLQWSSVERLCTHVALSPTAFNTVELIAKQNMR